MTSKIFGNVVELNKSSFDSSNNRVNYTTAISSNGVVLAEISAAVYANGAFEKANAAFNSANNVAPQIQPAFNTANAAFAAANTKLEKAGGEITGNLIVAGNLTVTGNVVSLSATNLAVEDNMIYLNHGSTVSNPDLGLAGNYNDGTYQHTGLFRDASDGIWKFYEGYTLEPDASAFIDTTHASFKIANLTANIISDSITVRGFNLLNHTNNSYAHANAAFESANNVAPQIQPAFSTANSAGDYANGAFVQANAAFNAANTISLNKIYKNDTSVEAVDANTTNSRIIITVDANTVTEVSSSNLKINLSTVATSTTTGALQVLGGAGITGNLHVGGTIYAVGDVVSSYSDSRLKDKTRDVTEALSIISGLNAFYYTANDTARKFTRTDDEEKVGLSAQDVQKVLPSVVSLSAFDTELDDNGNVTSKTGQNYLTVDYARIVPILIQAIKEQQKEIDLLKEKINGIHNR